MPNRTDCYNVSYRLSTCAVKLSTAANVSAVPVTMGNQGHAVRRMRGIRNGIMTLIGTHPTSRVSLLGTSRRRRSVALFSFPAMGTFNFCQRKLFV